MRLTKFLSANFELRRVRGASRKLNEKKSTQMNKMKEEKNSSAASPDRKAGFRLILQQRCHEYHVNFMF